MDENTIGENFNIDPEYSQFELNLKYFICKVIFIGFVIEYYMYGKNENYRYF